MPVTSFPLAQKTTLFHSVVPLSTRPPVLPGPRSVESPSRFEAKVSGISPARVPKSQTRLFLNPHLVQPDARSPTEAANQNASSRMAGHRRQTRTRSPPFDSPPSAEEPYRFSAIPPTHRAHSRNLRAGSPTYVEGIPVLGHPHLGLPPPSRDVDMFLFAVGGCLHKPVSSGQVVP